MKIYRVTFKDTQGAIKRYEYFSAGSLAKRASALFVKEMGGTTWVEEKSIDNSKKAVISLLNEWALGNLSS